MARIYVGNLPYSATQEEVRALFEAHGPVHSVALSMDRETGRPRGFGFVEMNQGDASRAIHAVNGVDLGGRPLRVNEAMDKPRGPGARSGGNRGGYGGGGGDRGGQDGNRGGGNDYGGGNRW
jgi:cold-inducible RNA-binding protein